MEHSIGKVFAIHAGTAEDEVALGPASERGGDGFVDIISSCVVRQRGKQANNSCNIEGKELDGEMTIGCQFHGDTEGDSSEDREQGNNSGSIGGMQNDHSSSEEDRRKHAEDSANTLIVQGIVPCGFSPPQERNDTFVSPSPIGGREMSRMVRLLHQSAVARKPSVGFSVRLENASEIKFDVRIDGNKVFITATVDDARSAAALACSIGELRSRLEQAGLTLGRCKIRTAHSRESPELQTQDSQGNKRGEKPRAKILARQREEGCSIDMMA